MSLAKVLVLAICISVASSEFSLNGTIISASSQCDLACHKEKLDQLIDHVNAIRNTLDEETAKCNSGYITHLNLLIDMFKPRSDPWLSSSKTEMAYITPITAFAAVIILFWYLVDPAEGHEGMN